jgi:NitT/TauT family transport system substrate-binding protein
VKAGIDARLTQFNGPDQNILALQSGNVDVAHNPWTTTIAAYADNSKNLRIIGGSGVAGIELVARAGSVECLARCRLQGQSPTTRNIE